MTRNAKTEMKLAVMEALAKEKLTLFQLVFKVEDWPEERVLGQHIGAVLQELEDGNYVRQTGASATVAPIYEPTHIHALSDLRASLLPSRDPVRDAHEHEQKQHSSLRYRRPTQQGADLDLES